MIVKVKTDYVDDEDVYLDVKEIKQKKEVLEIKKARTELNGGYALDVEELIKIPLSIINYYKVEAF